MDQDPNDEQAGSRRYYQMGDLIVDLETRQVAAPDGRWLNVDELSFQLLDALIKAAPKAVNAADLHAALWGSAPAGEDQLAQQVGALELALGTANGGTAYVGMTENGEYWVAAQPVRPRVRRKTVPKFLVPVMLFLVVAMPVVAYFIANSS